MKTPAKAKKYPMHPHQSYALPPCCAPPPDIETVTCSQTVIPNTTL